jgi:hypothetical protein
MQHESNPIDNPVANLRIGQIRFDKVDSRANAAKPLDPSSAEIIDDPHTLAALEQTLDKMGANEPRATSYQEKVGHSLVNQASLNCQS